MPQPEEIETLNRFLVGIQGDNVVIGRFAPRLTRNDAILLAAYLVAMADVVGLFGGPGEKRAEQLFAETLKAIQSL